MYNYVLNFLVFGEVIWNFLCAENVIFLSPFCYPLHSAVSLAPAMTMYILTLSCYEIRWVSVFLQNVGKFLPDNKKSCYFLIKYPEVYMCAEEGA